MRVLGIDTETHLISQSCGAPRPVCLTTSEGQGQIFVGPEMGVEFERLLDPDEGVILIGHNLAFDTVVLGTEFPHLMPLIFAAYREGRLICTQVREQLRLIETGAIQKPNTRVSLAACLKRHFAGAVDKADDEYRLKYATLERVPLQQWPSKAVTYAIEDAKVALKLFKAQGEITSQDRLQSASAFYLRLVGARGVSTDPQRVRALTHELTSEQARLEAQLLADGVLVVEKGKLKAPAKRKQELIAQALGSEAPRTKTGKVKCDAATLKLCGDKAEPLVRLQQWEAARKLLSTYLAPMQAGLICSSPNVLVASGRTSWRGPNLQNQPQRKGLRECFVPRPGYVFIAADYDSLESRCLAQAQLDLLGRSRLAQRFNEDPALDVHTETASIGLGISYEEGLTRLAAGDVAFKAARKDAKAANFGFPGGMGVDKFAKLNGYTRGKALKLRDLWFQALPEMPEYFAAISSIAKGSRKLTLPRSNRTRGDVGFCDGANYLFQGPASDGAKAALALLTEDAWLNRLSALYGCRGIAFIHDEFIFEAPEGRAHQALERMTDLMVAGMQTYIPDVPIRASGQVMDRWYKSDPGGRTSEGVWTDARRLR